MGEENWSSYDWSTLAMWFPESQEFQPTRVKKLETQGILEARVGACKSCLTRVFMSLKDIKVGGVGTD